MIRFSRSHQEAAKFCLRQLYLRYYAGGTGYERKGLNFHARTGSLCHDSLAAILLYARHNGLPPPNVVDCILANEVKRYREEVAAKGFDLGVAVSSHDVNVQAALAEGLVRAWVARRLPFILEYFTIVAVEEEWTVTLAPGVELMVRIDGVLERKDDLSLHALEFKTTGYDRDDYFEGFRYSVQTMAHLLGIDDHFHRPGTSVMMEFLLKGYHRKVGDAKVDTYYSPLVRGFVKRGVPPFDATEYTSDSDLGRRKGWEPINSWDFEGGVKGWVEALALEVLNGALAARQVFRNDRDLDIWAMQTVVQQQEIEAGLAILKGDLESSVKGLADNTFAAYFPARMDEDCLSNKYRRKCAFLDVCWGEVELEGAVASGEFVARDPHHVGEFEA